MKVTILNKLYNLKIEWEEVSLIDAANILKLDIPESLKKCYDALLNKDKNAYANECKNLTSQQEIKDHPVFFGKVISILSDIPQDIIDLVGWESRTEWYHNFFEKIYLDCYHFSPQSYEGKGLKEFNFKDVDYFFPESLKIFDKEIPMYKESSISFTEEADIIASITDIQEIGRMAQVAAVMCREKEVITRVERVDELVRSKNFIKRILRIGDKSHYNREVWGLELKEYDESEAIARAELFKDLPMNIIWEVFFYIIRQSNISVTRALIYLSNLEGASKKD